MGRGLHPQFKQCTRRLVTPFSTMKSPRILIVRLSAVGDVILSVPVACALRRLYPEAHISWIVQKGAAPLLQNHPAIDELITIPKLNFKTPLTYFDALRQARQAKPDIAIDIQGLLKTALIAFRSGAKKRIGFARSDFEGRECSNLFYNTIVRPTEQHVTLRGLELLRPLGLKELQVEYNFPEFDEDQAFAEKVRADSFHGGGYAIINVGAGWESKLWPSDRYGAVASHLFQKHGLKTLIVWGGKKEEAIANEVQRHSPEGSIIAPPTNLTQLRAILRGGAIFVGSDTGPMHLSAALGTPTVGLIGPMPSERVGPLGPMHRTIQNERLPLNDRHRRRSDVGPMLSIQIDTVNQAVDSLLAQNEASSAS